jgi:hypothetical protein
VSVVVTDYELGAVVALLRNSGIEKVKTRLLTPKPKPQAEPAETRTGGRGKRRKVSASRASFGEVGNYVAKTLPGIGGDIFRMNDLLVANRDDGGKFPANSIRSAVSRMLKAGILVKKGRATYQVVSPVAEAAE